MTGKISKIQRQILLLTIFSFEESIIDLDVIKLNVSIDIRTLQRDIKELTEAGFMDVCFDRKENRYSGKVYIPVSFAQFDEKKQRYYEKVRHYEIMIFGMYESLASELVDEAVSELELHDYLYEKWIKDGKDGYEPEYRGPVINEEFSADRVYFRLFPKASKDDFLQDVQFINDIGFYVGFCERLKVYYTDFPEVLEA